MLKTLLLYSTHHHHTEERISKLNTMLDVRPFPINVKEEDIPDFTMFDMIIIGAPIYIGNIDMQITKAIKDHHDTLLKMPHAIFTLGLQDGKDAERNIEFNFPKDVLDSAFAVQYLGGSVDESNLNIAEKTFIKVLKKTIRRNRPDLNNFDDEALQSFADKINAEVAKIRAQK